MRSLPKVVSNIPNDLRAFVDRVREYIANAGDDAFVTKGELLRAGVIGATPGGTIIPPGSVVVQDPPVPTGLATSGALATIIVTWDAPLYGGHLETRVWAAATDDFSARVLVGASPGATFAHNVGGGASKYYWIQHVNVDLVEGPFNSNNGTLGTTGTDPAYILDVLDGSITESQLYSGLNARIDLIDGSPSTTGTIPNQLAILQGQIDALAATPTYDNSTAYVTGDIVQYSGGLYQAIADTTGNLPTDTDYWVKIGDYSSLGDAVAAHTTEIATLTTDLGAETTARELLASQMRGTYTGTDLSLVTSGLIYSERQARTSADSAEVTARETLAAQVRGSYDGTDLTQVTSGLIYSERTARANADSALASDISTLSTTVGNQTTAVQTLSQSVDGIKGLYTVKIDNNGSVGGFGLESVLENTDIALWTATTYYTVGAVRRVSGVSTKVMRCTVAGTSSSTTPTLAGNVGTTFTDGTVTWEIASSTATSTFITNVDKFAVTTPTSSIPAWAANTAYTAGSFVGTATDTSRMLICKVAGTSGGTSPSIIAAALGALVTDGTVVWQVASRVPLSVLTSSQVINGITVPPGLYVDGASIVNATITNAAIGNLAVDNAKIANMAVDKLTAGSLQVGSYIQSTSYSAGTSGWRINADGTAEFANAVVRGNIYGSSATSFGSGEGLFSGRDTLAISSITRSTTVATMTTAQVHGLAVGSSITISGSTNGWNGTYTITAVPTTTTAQFTVSSGLATPATGTMTVYTPYRFRVGNPSGNQITWNGAALTISGNILGGSATGYLTGTGLFAGLDGTTYKFRVGNPSGAYMYWDGTGLKFSAAATNVVDTPNLVNNSVSQLVANGRYPSYIQVFDAIGTTTNITTLTAPATGTLVVTCMAHVRNFSSVDAREIQLVIYVNNSSQLEFPVTRLPASGANGRFSPAGPDALTSGTSTFITQVLVANVSQGASVPIALDCIPAADNIRVYVLDFVYSAVLYKK